MNTTYITSQFVKHKESSLSHRYITLNHIEPLLKKLPKIVDVRVVGKSVLGDDIHTLKIGNGNKNILMWSQMHGNESTTTKAIFDLLNTFLKGGNELNHILNECTLYIIPILNPDGAKAYTRINANDVDLNRDAQNLSQPESIVLRKVFKDVQPDFCFNLHGQRTIFSAGLTNKIATISFLTPAEDKDCTITDQRKVSMEVITCMNETLQEVIPGQVGVYDDAFNINCVGDTFQSENIPTILFEAGHYKNDYAREETRKYIYMSLVSGLDYIAKNNVDGSRFEPYLDIPENGKCFLDVIIRGAKVDREITDIGFLFKETLVDGEVKFIPRVEKIENLDSYFGHREIMANGAEVLGEDSKVLKTDSENVFVKLNNEKIALFSK